MNKYKQQREWSDSYIPQVNDILRTGIRLRDSDTIEITSDEVDMKEAADLVIKRGKQETRIALRLREKSYMSKYPYDFTIRFKYAAGYKTEFKKIEEGMADLMFYGFIDGKSIIRWILLDLDALRKEIDEDYIVYEQNPNKDGRNEFRGYDIRSFKEKDKLIIIKSDGYFDLIELMLPKNDGTLIGSKIFKQR